MQSKPEITPSNQKTKSKHTRGSIMNAFRQVKIVCKMSPFLAFNRATNGETDIEREYHEHVKTDLNESERLPHWRRSTLDITCARRL